MSKIINEQCNFQIVGAWNAAIINPGWIKEQFGPEFVDSDTQIQYSFLPAPSVRFSIKNVYIDSNNGKLLFQPEEIDNESLGFISNICGKIYDKLPHTPVAAAGCNFVYKLEPNEDFNAIISGETDQIFDFYKTSEMGELNSRKIQHAFSYSDHELNIIYTINGNIKTIQYNFHYQGKANIQAAISQLVDNFAAANEHNKKLITQIQES